jgi:hypothetical protein
MPAALSVAMMEYLRQQPSGLKYLDSQTLQRRWMA